MDASGDGTGDFQGLMRRLDYLHGLGVTAIWLMPCRDDARRKTTRHSCFDRSRSQPHLGSASMVQAGALRSKFQISQLVRLVQEEAAAFE